MTLPQEVRAHAARIVAGARAVRIDTHRLDALDWLAEVPPPALDPERHFLEGSEADVTAYLLTVAAVNFGSGWFPTLTKRRGPGGRPVSGANTVAWALTDRFRAHGPWTNAQLRGMRTTELAEVLGQRPDHELMALYAQALRELGAFLAERTPRELVVAAGQSAATLAAELAGGMTMWADRGFYKRAQLVAHDLALAGLARFHDHKTLTIFADNLVPHVLRCDGILVYDELLAAHVDGGELLPFGPWEREIRASAVHACALLAPRLGLSEPALDTALWNRGQEPAYKARPRHRCRCVYY